MYAADSIRKYQVLLESAMSDKDVERQEAQQKKAKEAKAAKKEEKKPANVKESAAEFFRRYSDIIVEAEKVDEGKSRNPKTGKMEWDDGTDAEDDEDNTRGENTPHRDGFGGRDLGPEDDEPKKK